MVYHDQPQLGEASSLRPFFQASGPVAGTSEKVTEDVVDLSGCEKIKTENLEFIKIKCD